MASSLETRVRVLEEQLAVLRRELAQAVARPAAPLSPRQGWFLGYSNSELTAGGTISVTVIAYQAGQQFQPGMIIEDVHEFFLNAGQSVSAGVKMKVEWYRNVWVVTQFYCTISNTIPPYDS
jgi:hypothetical protein